MIYHPLAAIRTMLVLLLALLMPLLAQADLVDVASNGPVYATALGSDGTRYLGGDFTMMQANTGGGAQLEAGTAAVSRQFPTIQGSVQTAVSDGAGGWYIGGLFSKVGEVARSNLAHILSTGAVDPNWNPGPNSRVNVLAISTSGSTVYAGGNFTSIGGQTRKALAAIRTDGTLTN